MFRSKTARGDMRPARDISSLLSKIQYAIRLTVFSQAIQVSQRTEVDPEEALDPIQRWIHETQRTVFRWVRHSISTASKACMLDARMPNIMALHSDGSAYSYRGQVILLDLYKDYAPSLVATCQTKLEKLLSGVEWKDIARRLEKRADGWGLQDDVSREDAGYSVFEDPANGVQNAWQELLGRMVATGQFGPSVTNPDTGKHEIRWDIPVVHNWADAADDMCGSLYVATFESFAAPPRSPEFSSTLVRNIPGRLRNFFKINEITTMILNYNKTTPQTGMDNPIARSLPFSLQRILDFYIAIIKHIVWFFSTHVLKLPIRLTNTLTTHLWALHNGRILDCDDLTGYMRRAIEPFMGRGVSLVYGIRCNRHLKKALGRRCIENHPAAKSMNEASLKLFESQAGHSQAIADMFYARLGGMSYHPVISARNIRQHQILGQIMHGVFGYAPPPNGNLELEPEQPPEWVFQPREVLRPLNGGSLMT